MFLTCYLCSRLYWSHKLCIQVRRIRCHMKTYRPQSLHPLQDLLLLNRQRNPPPDHPGQRSLRWMWWNEGDFANSIAAVAAWRSRRLTSHRRRLRSLMPWLASLGASTYYLSLHPSQVWWYRGDLLLLSATLWGLAYAGREPFGSPWHCRQFWQVGWSSWPRGRTLTMSIVPCECTISSRKRNTVWVIEH